MGNRGRVLAIDWGEARIGVALSDVTRMLATPHTTLFEKDRRQQIERVVALVGELEVTQVLVGLPLHMDGRETRSTRPATKYAEKLATRVAVPVTLVDERLTSREAEERLTQAGHKVGRANKGLVDSAAAAVLLQDWLDAQGVVEDRAEQARPLHRAPGEAARAADGDAPDGSDDLDGGG